MSVIAYSRAGALLTRDPLRPAYYFVGPVDVLKDEAVQGLLERALDPGVRDFNFDQRSAGQLDPEDVETLCRTLPMMAERRVVILRDVEAWARKARAKQAVLRYLDQPSAETVLILIQGAAEPEADAELAARATTVQFDPLEQSLAERWLRKRAEQAGVALTPEAAAHLVATAEGDVGVLAAELAKLTGLGGGEPVTLEQVSALLGVRHGETQFDWRDAVLGDAPGRALAILPHLLEQPGMSGVRLLMLLGTTLTGVAMARTLLDGGARGTRLESAVFEAIRRARLFGIDYRATARAWSGWASTWPAPRIRAALRAAREADLALKSTTISDERGILTDLVLRLALAHQEAA